MLNYLLSVLQLKCPRCRTGNMFVHNTVLTPKFMEMHERCTVCQQRTEIEVGFYVGSGYVSYALTVAISVATFVAWWVLIGFSLEDNRIFWWLGLNSIFFNNHTTLAHAFI